MDSKKHSLMDKLNMLPFIPWGEKSFSACLSFMGGYNLRDNIIKWEELTGRDFIKDFNEPVSLFYHTIARKMTNEEYADLYKDSMDFTFFVEDKLNCRLGSADAIGVVQYAIKADDEAFDKYFELHEEFLKQKETAIDTL